MSYLSLIKSWISIVAVFTFVASAQVEEYAALTDDEKRLAKLFNQNMQDRGLKIIPVSKKLTAVARWNTWDLQQNKPHQQENCNIYSWSDKKPSKWAAFCASSDVSWSPWWKKPEEVAGYQKNSLATAVILANVKNLKNAIKRINKIEYLWETDFNKIKTYGVSFRDGYVALWFGKADDALGYHSTTDRLSNISGLWYDPNQNGVGFHFVTLTDNTIVFTYYGKTQTGENLWLISPAVSVKAETTVVVDMYEATKGTFQQPVSGTQKWGRLTIRLASCQHGKAKLEGKDGVLSLDNLQILASPDQVDCI